MSSWGMGRGLVLLPDSQAEDGVVFQVMDLQEGRQGEASHVNTLPNEEA